MGIFFRYRQFSEKILYVSNAQIGIREEVSIRYWEEIGRLLKVWNNTTGFALTFKNDSSVLTG